MLGPLPVCLVSLGTFDKPNIITVAWTGIINSKPPMTYISVRPERFSHGILEERGEFVINMPDTSLARRVDLCGMRSGSKGDKFKICGFEKLRAEALEDCPVIGDCPVNLECRVKDVLRLGSHDMYLAEIVNVSVNESLADDKGAVNFKKADLLAYLHGEYAGLGKGLGRFGFSVKKTK